MNANDLRRRASQLLADAESVLTSVPEGDEPPADLQERHDKLTSDAQTAIERAEQLEAMESRRAALAARAAAGPEPGAHNDARNTRGRHVYSAARALAAHANGRQPDGLEGEVHVDLARERSVASKGVIVPMDAEISYRAHSAAGAIGQLVRGPIRDALMARLVLAQAGVETIVSPTVFKLPLASTGSTYWVSNAAPTEADRNIGQAAFTPKTISGATTAGRQDLVTASVGVVDYIFRQLVADLSVGIQAGCLHGTGSSGQPKGTFVYSGGDGVTVKALGTNGLALTYADVLALAGAVAAANAGDGSFITNPSVFSKLEATVKVTGQASFVADAAAKTIAGRPAHITGSVSSTITKGSSGATLSAIAFGDWTQAVIGMFSGLDVLINPYTDHGGVKVSAFCDLDFQLVRPAAFAIATDVVTV
ncbi:MAG TPA: phage major capsid protein [Acidimicrobiales bacterium]